eukprot:376388_1
MSPYLSAKIHHNTIYSQATHNRRNQLQSPKFRLFGSHLPHNTSNITHNDPMMNGKPDSLTEEKEIDGLLFDEHERGCTTLDPRLYTQVALHRLHDKSMQYKDDDTLDVDTSDISTALNDYLHLSHHHDDQEIAMIRNAQGTCNIHNCESFKRTNRLYRPRAISLYPYPTDVRRAIYQQTLDKVHCFFHHPLDIEKEKCMIENAWSHGDTNALLKLRNKTIGVHGTYQRYTQFRLKDSVECYSFGYKFKYNDVPGESSDNKDDVKCVSAKYSSLKEELTQNKLMTISITRFTIEEHKSLLYFGTQHGQSLHLKLEHILAIMIYCNHDPLQAEFSRTYREPDLHNEFYHFGRHLKRCVHEHGTRIRNGRVRSFYHGITQKMFFPRYINHVQIFSPLSTTSSYAVAVHFTNNEGLIVEFGDGHMGFLRYFDCGWLSDYPNEQELLFIQNKYPLQVVDIRIDEMEKGVRYHWTLSALHFIDKLMSSQQIDRDSDIYHDAFIGLLSYQIICHRLSLTSSLYQPMSSLIMTDYARAMIDTYLRNKKSIKIDLNYLKQSPFSSMLDVLFCSHDHTLNMSHISTLFPSLEHIEIAYLDDVSLVKSFVLDILHYLDCNPRCSVQRIDVLCHYPITEFNVEHPFELLFEKNKMTVLRTTVELDIPRYFPYDTDPIYYQLFQYFKHNQQILNFVYVIYIWNTNVLNVVQYFLDHRLTDSYFDIVNAKHFHFLLDGKCSRTIIEFICCYGLRHSISHWDYELFTPFAHTLMREANTMETYNIPHILDTHPTYINQIQKHIHLESDTVSSDLNHYFRQNPTISKLVFTLYVWNESLLNVIESVLGMDHRVADPYVNRCVGATKLPEPFESVLNETCGASVAKYISSQPVTEDKVWQQLEDMLITKRDDVEMDIPDTPTIEGVPPCLQQAPDAVLCKLIRLQQNHIRNTLTNRQHNLPQNIPAPVVQAQRFRWIIYGTPIRYKRLFKPYENAFIGCNGDCGSLLAVFVQRCIHQTQDNTSFIEYQDVMELAFSYRECPLRMLLAERMRAQLIHDLHRYKPIYSDLMDENCFITGGIWIKRMTLLFSNLYSDNHIQILQAITNRSCKVSNRSFWDEIYACYHTQNRILDPKPYWSKIERVKQKKQYKIMQSMNKGLSNFELMSIFLYCNGSLCATQMRKSHQNNQSNSCEWKYLYMYLCSAIEKIYESLHLYNEYFQERYIENRRPKNNKLFHGLKDVSMDKNAMIPISMYTVTSFSETYRIAESFTRGDGMILVLNDAYRAIYDGRLRAANVSWISTWKGEQEWIVLPTQFMSVTEIKHDNVLYSCYVRSERTEIYEINFSSNTSTIKSDKQIHHNNNLLDIPWIALWLTTACLLSIVAMVIGSAVRLSVRLQCLKTYS